MKGWLQVLTSSIVAYAVLATAAVLVALLTSGTDLINLSDWFFLAGAGAVLLGTFGIFRTRGTPTPNSGPFNLMDTPQSTSAATLEERKEMERSYITKGSVLLALAPAGLLLFGTAVLITVL